MRRLQEESGAAGAVAADKIASDEALGILQVYEIPRGSMLAIAGPAAIARASDPKMDAGFGKNPMRKQKAGAAAPIPSVRPPL